MDLFGHTFIPVFTSAQGVAEMLAWVSGGRLTVLDRRTGTVHGVTSPAPTCWRTGAFRPVVAEVRLR